jgi:hypothetical protein
VLEAAGTEESGCRRGFSGSRDKESRSRDGCSDSGAGRGIRQQRRFRQKRAFAEVESRDQEAGTRDQTAEIGV